MGAGKKRQLQSDDASAIPKAKRNKTNETSKKSADVPRNQSAPSTSLVAEEVDFPRGGGTSFSPLEVKAIRAEAVKEANDALFEDKPAKRSKRKSDVGQKLARSVQKVSIRVEHLNYKRIVVGMKILGQIVAVQPLALVVSLPNQLFAHVPITEISTQLTNMLESMDEDGAQASEDEEGENSGGVPDLFEIFHPGQYIRAVVSTVHPPGATDVIGLSRNRDELLKASKRVELSLVPEKVNAGVAKADLRTGFSLSAAVKSVEDHGYILDLGLPDVAGFLSFKDARQGSSTNSEKKLRIGQLIDVCVSKMSENGRTCTVTFDPAKLTTASLSEISSFASVLPGSLVQSLVTSVLPDGFVLQCLGFFDGTIDEFHLPSGDLEEHYKVGQKIKARVLYDINSASPPKLALSLAEHVLKLAPKTVSGEDESDSVLPDAYPIGHNLQAVKVIKVEPERGLVVSVSEDVEGFVHISQVSDEHVPSLSASSGPWKIGTVHNARVTGYYPLDGLLQLSLRPSVLAQKFLEVGDVRVGEVIKGTIKRLTDSAMFVSISGNVDGVIWPNHYADIALKHPQKRFKPGGTLKCRVLVVDPDRKRVVLTAKKSLLDSPLPIVSSMEDVKVGLVTHAVVFKVSDKSLLVEFYNSIKAIVPAREASETVLSSLLNAFPVGKPVRVKITSVDSDNSRIVASIRQASGNYHSATTDVSGVEIGDSVEGVVAGVQKEKAVVTLQPTQVRALLSLANLAKRREVPVAGLRSALKPGDRVEDLVVMARSPEKGFVLVATKPKKKEALIQKGALNLDTIQVGQIVGGRVLRHARQGALVKLTNTISGVIHPTDTCDDFESGNPFPPVDSVLRAVVLAVDKDKKQLTLSTRRSRLNPDGKAITDQEISSFDDLHVGDMVRGFIKNVADHGLFVMLGRNIDARIQIKELFDNYVKDWKSHFSINQLVRGRILRVDPEKKQVEMTFKSGDVKRDAATQLSLADISEGQKVNGRVKKIEQYGLFIEIEGSKLTGLCHKSELSDNKDADVTLALRSFREGDRVKAIILSIDKDTRRISLGLKPSYFTEEDFDAGSESEADDDEIHDSTLEVVESQSEPDDDDNNEVALENASSADDSDVDMDDVNGVVANGTLDMNLSNDSQQSSQKQPGNTQSAISLALSEGFQWSAEQENEEGSDEQPSSDEEDDEHDRKKKKRKHKEIEQDLTAEMHTKVPESNADFERALLGSPNSSYLWVQFMSFQLQISEVEKAREVGRRALRTINFREEQEKMNVWVALLNLENIYGTEETLEATFKDAARHNDSKTIHLRLAAILDQSDKVEKAEEQYKRACKKFGKSSKVWTLFGEFYLKRGKLEEARKLLPRSLQSLEKRKHLKTISKFAQLEYKFGDPERGKTIFEGIVDSHPKRWDLWSIYLDMEAGQGDIMSLRNIFERVLTLKMTSHKAKSFFKKWLDLERKIGDEEGASVVKAKAIEWTQRASASS